MWNIRPETITKIHGIQHMLQGKHFCSSLVKLRAYTIEQFRKDE